MKVSWRTSFRLPAPGGPQPQQPDNPSPPAAAGVPSNVARRALRDRPRSDASGHVRGGRPGRRRARLRVALVPRTPGPAGGHGRIALRRGRPPARPAVDARLRRLRLSGLPGRPDEPHPAGDPRLQPRSPPPLRLGPGHPDGGRRLRRPPRGGDRGRLAGSRMGGRRTRLRPPGCPSGRGPGGLPTAVDRAEGRTPRALLRLRTGHVRAQTGPVTPPAAHHRGRVAGGAAPGRRPRRLDRPRTTPPIPSVRPLATIDQHRQAQRPSRRRRSPSPWGPR